MRHVILCDEKGHPNGIAEIEAAHKSPGMLHKAFSVFLFDQHRKELLIQKRVRDKLFGELWSNTCCSHPQQGEKVNESGMLRTKVECGFECPPLQELFSFVYEAEDPNGKGYENEYDTVLIGKALKGIPFNPNPEEVEELKWINVEHLKNSMESAPEIYTPWFIQALKRILGTRND
ncbi:isopentenyl-diphosphate Delta-isomerase [Patescibacteria group bacterium]|nr:isopentenyl-diphosphate Delta-isomerase [Patescibacteria group bacterium]